MKEESQEKVDISLLKAISHRYNFSADDLNFIIAIDNNFVYSFSMGKKEYILRGGTRHSADQVQAELEWILFLDANGVKVSVPILSKNNRYMEIVEHNGEEICAVVFDKAHGRDVCWNDPNEWNEELWQEMGRVLGAMHSAAVKYNSMKPKFKRKTAFESAHGTAENHLDLVKDEHIIKRFNDLKKKISMLPKEEEAYGLIQYDFHPANFKILNGEITLYDFDDSYYFFFIYDIATCIHEIVYYYPKDEKQNFLNHFIPALWKGYSEKHRLNRKWLEYLPDFFKWREFTIYISLVETVNDKTTPEEFKVEAEEYLPIFRAMVETDKPSMIIPEDRLWI